MIGVSTKSDGGLNNAPSVGRLAMQGVAASIWIPMVLAPTPGVFQQALGLIQTLLENSAKTWVLTTRVFLVVTGRRGKPFVTPPPRPEPTGESEVAFESVRRQQWLLGGERGLLCASALAAAISGCLRPFSVVFWYSGC